MISGVFEFVAAHWHGMAGVAATSIAALFAHIFRVRELRNKSALELSDSLQKQQVTFANQLAEKEVDFRNQLRVSEAAFSEYKRKREIEKKSESDSVELFSKCTDLLVKLKQNSLTTEEVRKVAAVVFEIGQQSADMPRDLSDDERVAVTVELGVLVMENMVAFANSATATPPVETLRVIFEAYSKEAIATIPKLKNLINPDVLTPQFRSGVRCGVQVASQLGFGFAKVIGLGLMESVVEHLNNEEAAAARNILASLNDGFKSNTLKVKQSHITQALSIVMKTSPVGSPEGK